MSKVFSLVGVARVRENAPLKLKVANGKLAARVARLERFGMVDVTMFEVKPMTKEKALVWLKANHPALAADIAEKTEVAPKVAKKATKSKVVKAAAKNANVEVVDVPLSPAAKLALKRAKDAARKREKRAEAKALALLEAREQAELNAEYAIEA